MLTSRDNSKEKSYLLLNSYIQQLRDLLPQLYVFNKVPNRVCLAPGNSSISQSSLARMIKSVFSLLQNSNSVRCRNECCIEMKIHQKNRLVLGDASSSRLRSDSICSLLHGFGGWIVSKQTRFLAAEYMTRFLFLAKVQTYFAIARSMTCGLQLDSNEMAYRAVANASLSLACKVEEVGAT